MTRIIWTVRRVRCSAWRGSSAGRAFRPVVVHCFVCPNMSGDEQALIEAIGALQLGDRETARAIFDEFPPPIASRFAVDPANGVARAFMAAGYRLMV